MNVAKRIAKKSRPNLLLADIVFDVFSEDGSQGSAGGDGEYLFFLYLCFFYVFKIHRKNRKLTLRMHTTQVIGNDNEWSGFFFLVQKEYIW